MLVTLYMNKGMGSDPEEIALAQQLACYAAVTPSAGCGVACRLVLCTAL